MKSHERLLTALTLAASMALPVAAAAETPESTTPAPESAAPAPVTPTPGKAAMFSIIPGLSQHKMGNHGKAFLMEGAVVGGIVLVATSGSNSGSGDGEGSYTPPSSAPGFATIEFAHGGGGGGGGGGNGDDEGNSTTRIVGVGMIVGGVAWSVIDAYRSAGRQSTKAVQDSKVEPGKESRVGMNVVPSLSGVWATLAVRF